jgi:hypothetical protein
LIRTCPSLPTPPMHLPLLWTKNLWLICAVLSLSLFEQAAARDLAPFDRLALDLQTRAAPLVPVKLGVGKFINSDNNSVTPFSGFLRDSMETALSLTEKFQVVTRNNLGELQLENRFQKTRLVTPGTPRDNLRIDAIEGLVRGSYYIGNEKIFVFVEIAWMDGGGITKTSLQIDNSTLNRKDVWEEHFHTPLDREKIRLHVLTSAFSKDAVKEYPEWVEKLKSNGYLFAVWTSMEEGFGSHPSFELFMEPGSLDDTGFLQDFIKEETALDPNGQPNAMVSVISKIFIKRDQEGQERFTVEISLRYFDLTNKPWYRGALVASAIETNNPDPLLASRRASEKATEKLIETLRRKGLI